METYEERVLRRHEERMASLRSDMEREPKMLEVRLKIARLFDSLIGEVTPTYDWVGGRFEMKFKSVEEAREFTDKLLVGLEIDKAEKLFDGWGSVPLWFYQIDYEEITIRIEPAEPSADCVPVPKASATTHWVCEKKKG